MGATDFLCRGKGKTAKIAFNLLVRAYEDEHGTRGYTGTIAEKSSFVMIDVPEGTDPTSFINKLINDDDPRISDKWGPAGCCKVGPEEYLFFGFASC